MLQKLIEELKRRNLSKSEIEAVLLTLCGYNNEEISRYRFTCIKATKGLKTSAAQKLDVFGHYGIYKYIFRFLVPNFKNEALLYLYPDQKEQLQLWQGKIGED